VLLDHRLVPDRRLRLTISNPAASASESPATVCHAAPRTVGLKKLLTLDEERYLRRSATTGRITHGARLDEVASEMDDGRGLPF
jgi:hypothetical protein